MNKETPNLDYSGLRNEHFKTELSLLTEALNAASEATKSFNSSCGSANNLLEKYKEDDTTE